MNMTLSIPADVIHDVRVWAHTHHTTLNQYVREMLEAKALEVREERKKESERLVDFLEKHSIEVPDGWMFNREEVNRR